MNDYSTLRRYRVGGDGILQVQEVDGMKMMKVYCDINDIGRYIKTKLSKEDRERFADCDFIPVDISFDNHDMTYTTTLVVSRSL